MINQGTARELVLHDVPSKLDALEAEVEDLRHGAEFVQQISIKATCDFKDTANSDIVIIPAGARQREGESRLDLVARNVAIFESIVPPIAAASPDAVLLILTNPCDVMTHVATHISGFAPNKVIGTGTALDTSRFRALLAEYLDVDSGSVHGMVLGEHGDSSVAVWSQCTVGGVRLMDVNPGIGTESAEEGLRKHPRRRRKRRRADHQEKGVHQLGARLDRDEHREVHPAGREARVTSQRPRVRETRHRRGRALVVARDARLGGRAGGAEHAAHGNGTGGDPKERGDSRRGAVEDRLRATVARSAFWKRRKASVFRLGLFVASVSPPVR
jgi:hypothetical protein